MLNERIVNCLIVRRMTVDVEACRLSCCGDRSRCRRERVDVVRVVDCTQTLINFRLIVRQIK